MILDIDIKYAGVLPNKKIYQKPKQIFKKNVFFFFYMYIPVNITEVPYLAHVVKTQVIFMETFLSFRTHLLLCFSFWRWLIERFGVPKQVPSWVALFFPSKGTPSTINTVCSQGRSSKYDLSLSQNHDSSEYTICWYS